MIGHSTVTACDPAQFLEKPVSLPRNDLTRYLIQKVHVRDVSLSLCLRGKLGHKAVALQIVSDTS